MAFWVDDLYSLLSQKTYGFIWVLKFIYTSNFSYSVIALLEMKDEWVLLQKKNTRRSGLIYATFWILILSETEPSKWKNTLSRHNVH